MARPDTRLINSLRKTAQRLKSGAPYEWGHMGRCNCGHLIQTVMKMSDYEIVRSIDFELDEWTEHARHYCNDTRHKVDDIFYNLENIGFGYRDVMNMEYLSDPAVLEVLPGEKRFLRRNNKDDVILYMDTLADILEKENEEYHPERSSVMESENELVPA